MQLRALVFGLAMTASALPLGPIDSKVLDIAKRIGETTTLSSIFKRISSIEPSIDTAKRNNEVEDSLDIAKRASQAKPFVDIP
ncbi:uncharacterized protein N7498_001755 [Penicillium cinerascens]|uniref:Uncharacterized protein n=1 Tax=Penicillium cinerascens TaxID=70096 RepID=A0A9W9NA97_9EURO|nr:uncharacterized protein N7498_001755 [Penicillium cinerascens]KAJ5215348.1 hypothetical protein N7498_001755 [Penicillium cinerascens]